MTRALLTGATGFLGHHTTRALCDRGWVVRAFARATSRTEALEALGVEVVRGDLHDPASVRAALPDVDVVVHLAGGGAMLRVADVYRNNRDTTTTLVDAAVTCPGGPPRLVLVSSLAAHGPSPSGAPRDPAEPTTPTSHYGRSKAEAEAVALHRAEALHVTILRPPAVYGPGDTRMLPLFRAVARGFVPTLGGGGGERLVSMVYGPDCAAALAALAARSERPSGAVYAISDGHAHPWSDVLAALASALGRPRARSLRIPVGVLTVIAAANELRARLTGRPVPLTRDKVRDLRERHWVCDPAALSEAIGWSPSTALAEGIAATAADYRARGWLGP